MKSIPLSQGLFAIVDDDDYERLSQFKWHASKEGDTWYAARKNPGGVPSTIKMHREILGSAVNVIVDHRDLNGLNNVRTNLRECTKSDNMCNRGANRNNTSGFKGVCWDKQTSKWLAQITKDGKRKCLGRFASAEAAHRAYCVAAEALHGEFKRVA